MKLSKAFEPEFLSGGGEMGKRLREIDWSRTLGAPETWSSALKDTVALVLNNGFPMLLWWTQDYISIYNDAYIPVLGDKHPWGLGKPVRECWEEIWHVLQPLIDKPFSGGPPTRMEDIQLILNRKDYDEETHFVIAYSPVPDSQSPNGIGGVLATVNEITDQVINTRALATLSKINLDIATAHSEEEVYQQAAGALLANQKDFPFCIIYKIDEAGQTAQRIGNGFEATKNQYTSIDLGEGKEDPLRVAEAVANNAIVHSAFNEAQLDLPKGDWDVQPVSFIHLPVKIANRKYPHAIFTIGLNPYRKFDETYRQFVQLAADQIATGLVNVLAFNEEKKRLEALAEIDKAKTIFFTNISHELRTPLTLLLSPAEEMILADHDFPEPIRKNHEIIFRNGQRLLKLVNNLLDFSRIEAGKIQTKFEPADLGELTRDISSNFRSVIEKAGLEFIVKCETLSRLVFIDSEMWAKIILNLLSNAFKFTFEGRIIVTIQESPDGVTLEVTDTGIGIPEDELPNMFKRFHRVAGGQGRTYEGSGIGLSLVHELVKLHQGTISVESEAGKGSSFRVWLPFGAEAGGDGPFRLPEKENLNGHLTAAFLSEANFALRQDQQTEIYSHEQTAEKHFNILIVDDNADMRDYLGRILSSFWGVRFANNGKEALDQLRKQAADLVLSDIMMPVMDGIQLLAAVRSEFKLTPIPFIFLSARAGEEAKLEGLDYGADDYIVKPFSARELRAKVRTHLHANEAKSQAEKYLKELFINAPIALCMLKGDAHRIEFANERMLHIWGKRNHEAANKELSQVLPGAVYEEIHTLLEKVKKSGNSYHSEEIAVRDGFLQEMVIHYVAEPLRGANQNFDGIVLLANDITDLVEARKNAVASAEVLRALVTQKDEFMSIASHELKTPVTSMKAILQILQRTKMPNDQITGFVEKAVRQVSRLAELIADLLDVSAMEAGKINFSFDQFDFSTLLTEVAGQHQQLQQTHRISIIQNDNALIVGDRNRLEQVINNLLSNAVKYSPASDKVLITSRLVDESVQVSVTDFGIGIPKDKKSKVFERFYRVEDGARYFQGMGLGLHISSEIVKRHSGTIGVKQNPEGGSIFWFHVPVKQ